MNESGGGSLQFASQVLTATTYDEAVEIIFEQNLTDGLPVIIPTPERVQAFIDHVGRPPNESLGPVPLLGGEASIEKLAINAVMAGCKPEYFPFVIAAMEGILEPAHNISGLSSTTNSVVPLAIINGPAANELGFNAREGVFGSGYRTNGTVGRAIRLALWNLGGARPWDSNKKCLAQPGEWSFCIAENEKETPWEPLHVSRGFAKDANVVTVVACNAGHEIICYGTPDQMLTTLVDSIATLGHSSTRLGSSGGNFVLVINPLSAAVFSQRGWSKGDIQEHIWQHARRKVKEILNTGPITESAVRRLIAAGDCPPWANWDNPDCLMPITLRPEDILIVVAGGRSYYASALPGWRNNGGLAVSKEARLPGKRKS